jgi:hypothetical protein
MISGAVATDTPSLVGRGYRNDAMCITLKTKFNSVLKIKKF